MVHVAMRLHLTAREFSRLAARAAPTCMVHRLVPQRHASSSTAHFAAGVTRWTTMNVSMSVASCLSIMWMSWCVATIDVYASRPSACARREIPVDAQNGRHGARDVLQAGHRETAAQCQ